MKRLSDQKSATYIWQSPDWPSFQWNADVLIPAVSRARLCQGQLMTQIKAFGLKELRGAEAIILSEEALKTSEIEGEKLNPASVRSSVAKHLGLSTAGLPPIERHVDGLIEILLEATTHYKKPLTAVRIKGWQAALFPTGFSGLRKIRVGQWRSPNPMRVVSGSIGRERIHFEAPPRNKINSEIKFFLDWWKSSFGKIEGLIRAGIAHFYFVTIHPFEDGNGRIARALTDMALSQDEESTTRYYSLSHQIMAERKGYYDVLERCQKGDMDITKWLLWFLECLTHAIQNSEKLIAKVLAKIEFWKDHAQVSLNEHQRKVVNRLLETGPGNFIGGLTTRKYVLIAKVSRATAYREMSDLLSKKILHPNPGKGRNVSYDLVW